MRIGIDIDNTITDTHELLLKHAKKHDNKVLKKGIKDITQYEFNKIFHWNKQETKDFFSIYFQQLVPNIRLKKIAKKVINKLYNEGYEIYIITRRTNNFLIDPYKETKKWLDKNKLKYTKLFVNCIDKGKVCRENDIDLFIDDEVFNCDSTVENNIDTLLYTAPSNLNDNTHRRVNNWTEIYNIIKEEYDGRKGCNK